MALIAAALSPDVVMRLTFETVHRPAITAAAALAPHREGCRHAIAD